MFVSHLWSGASLLALLLVLQAFVVEASSLAVNRTGGLGLLGDNPLHQQCETILSPDRDECMAEAKVKYPKTDDRGCHYAFEVASCLVVSACNKCTSQSISYWIQVEQGYLNARALGQGDCVTWSQDCPHLACPSRPTTMLTTQLTTSQQSTTSESSFPVWAIVLVILLIVPVVLGLVTLYICCTQANSPNDLPSVPRPKLKSRSGTRSTGRIKERLRLAKERKRRQSGGQKASGTSASSGGGQRPSWTFGRKTSCGSSSQKQSQGPPMGTVVGSPKSKANPGTSITGVPIF